MIKLLQAAVLLARLGGTSLGSAEIFIRIRELTHDLRTALMASLASFTLSVLFLMPNRKALWTRPEHQMLAFAVHTLATIATIALVGLGLFHQVGLAILELTGFALSRGTAFALTFAGLGLLELIFRALPELD